MHIRMRNKREFRGDPTFMLKVSRMLDLLRTGRFQQDESGQTLIWVVFLLFLFLGMSTIVVDLGHGVLVKRQLQASADAAALAAARTLPNVNYAAVAEAYSSGTGDANANAGFTINSMTVTGKCLATVAGWGNPCTATQPNAVQVTETTTIKTFFAGVLGVKTLNIGATSTASRGAKPQPYNLAIILDTTPSMNYGDTSCGSGQSQLTCAEQGIQKLLSGLSPSLDNISLFTFPNITSDSASADYSCGDSSPTTGLYTFPSSTGTTLQTTPITTGHGKHQTTTQMTYQVTGYLADYRTSDSAKTLSSTSDLTKATGGKTNCPGMETSNQNTYYAAALYAAQASLTAEQAANPASQNIIILVSDGNATAQQSNMVTSKNQSPNYATASGTYPSWVGECSQGIVAANYATSQGTTVYTIAYGSPTTSSGGSWDNPNGNCASDITGSVKYPNVSPCYAMQLMSSGWASGDQSHFFSDDYSPTGRTGCAGEYGIGDLDDIFDTIVINLTASRLIPNDTP